MGRDAGKIAGDRGKDHAENQKKGDATPSMV